MKKRLRSTIIMILLVLTSFSLTACLDFPHIHNYATEIIVPTCIENGYTLHKCNCGDEYEDSTVEALGHEFNTYVSNNDATETEDGTETAVCQREGCNATDTRIDVGSALNGTTPDDPVEPEQPGVNTPDEPITPEQPGQHVHNYASEIIEPTCIEDGYTLHKCECGDEYGDSIVKALGHEAGETWQKDANWHWKTCKNEDCNLEMEKREHDFTNGDCVCGEVKGSEGLTYIIDKNSYIVTGIGTCLDKEIVIPSTYNGLPVTEIKKSAFRDTNITSVKISDSIKKIGSWAFEDCENLVFVEIGRGVTSIGDAAFRDCTRLTRIEYNAIDCDLLSSSNNNVFYNAGRKKDGIVLEIGKDVKQIPDYLFNPNTNINYYPNLTDVIFEENSVCDTIGKNAFYCCYELKNVQIPSSMDVIFYDAFAYVNSSLKVNFNGTIDEWAQIAFLTPLSNPIYEAENLYINNVLVKHADLTAAIEVSAYAFYNCKSLTKVTIGSDVSFIGDGAFANCFALTEVVYNATECQDGIFDLNNVLETYVFDTSKIYAKEIKLTIGKDVKKIPDYLFCGASIGKVIFEEDSTCEEIGDYAFLGCYLLKDLEIGSSVKKIGKEAFRYCRALTEIKYNAVECNDFNRENYLFDEAGKESSSIKLTVGKNVKKIPAYLFCPVLPHVHSTDVFIKEVIFEEGSLCESVGAEAFAGCKSLTKINYNGTIDEWAEIKFATSNANPTNFAEDLYLCEELVTEINLTSATKISGANFVNCRSVTNVTMGNSVKSIGFYAFSGCKSLTSIDIPNSITYIGMYAFANCDSLSNISIPDGITQIETGSFSSCDNLTSIVMSSRVISIASDAFSGCNSLTKVEYKGTIDEWAVIKFSDAEANPLHKASLYINGELVKEVNLTTATEVSSYAFYNCKSIIEVTIGSSVERIGHYAFEGCESLTIVDISNGVTNIWNRAFMNCESLTNIVIPNSVTKIYDNAFSNCTALTIYCEAKSKPSEWTSKWNVSNCPIVWDCLNNDVADDGFIYTVIDGIRYGIKDDVATVVKQPKNLITENIPNQITYKEVVYNVANIVDNVFSDCNSLTSLVIPNSVISIGYDAFNGCGSISSIYYYGAEEDWGKLEISNNVNVSNITYYYSESEPKLNTDETAYDGNYWYYVEGEPTIWIK